MHLNIPNGVASTKTDPLRKRAVLLLLLAEDLLDLKGLVRGLREIKKKQGSKNIIVFVK